MTNGIPLVMSIDVEDWFQVENLKPRVPRESWNTHELRVTENTRRILDIFDSTRTRATFFVLGWIADRVPDLVAEIAVAGHEIASHGYGHELVYNQTPAQFRNDLRKSKRAIHTAAGVTPTGYRAPSFSITEWAYQILAEEGFSYDSSVFPVRIHDRYGSVSVSGRSLFEDVESVREFPVLTWRVFGQNVPWGGGGYFRLLPTWLYEIGFVRAAKQRGGAVFYLHPWEVDPGQPRVDGLPRLHAFRHYVNLDRTVHRLRTLCEHHSFIAFRDLDVLRRVART